jgi:hypothetical protein
MINLQKKTLVDRDSLSESQLFSSLLEEAFQKKGITQKEMESIQLQLVSLLSEQTNRFTGGESSSVTIEIAERLLQSISYTIGLYLKSLPDTDQSLFEIRTKPLSELFLDGRNLVRLKLEQTKDTRAFIFNTKQGLKINIVTYVLPNINIPELASVIQDNVKEAIESITGVKVYKININIINIYNEQKLRLK